MYRRALLSLGALAGVQAAIPTAVTGGLCTQAAQAYRAGRIDQARTLYETVLASDPRCAPALGGLGWIHFLEHRRRQAARLLGLAYQQTPNDFTIVRDYAAAAGNTGLEGVLLQRLLNLPSTPERDRQRAQNRLAWRQRLAGRTLNELTSDYRPYQLRMQGSAQGWVLRVSLNGRRPLRLLLDTGARGLLIHQRKAEDLGLEALGRAAIGGFGDGPNEMAQTMLAARVQVEQELTLANVIVEVAGRRFIDGVDGLVSWDLFRHFLIACDGPRKQLALEPFAGANGTEAAGDHPWGLFEATQPAEGFQPYRRLGHLILLEDRSQPGRQWVLDSGASYTIVHEELPSLHAETVALVGLSGAAQLRRLPHPVRYHVGTAPAWSRDVVGTNLAGVSQEFGIHIAGFLGFPALRDRVLWINPRSGWFSLTQPGELSARQRP